MRDFATEIGPVNAIAPEVLSATATSGAIDLRGFNAAAVVISTGAIVGSGSFTPTVQESDTAAASGFTTVAAADMAGTLPATLAANTTAKASYIGNRRYIRVVLTRNSGTSVAAAAMVVRSRADSRPVA
ncbi:MAG: hypothetical protein AAF580_05895 [Pseudomonadota bacterium]